MPNKKLIDESVKNNKKLVDIQNEFNFVKDIIQDNAAVLKHVSTYSCCVERNKINKENNIRKIYANKNIGA